MTRCHLFARTSGKLLISLKELPSKSRKQHSQAAAVSKVHQSFLASHKTREGIVNDLTKNAAHSLRTDADSVLLSLGEKKEELGSCLGSRRNCDSYRISQLTLTTLA